jgi:hypothetical protein
MKKFLLVFVVSVQITYAQQVNKLITEENISRIIKTLAADDMKGRSATKPEHIEKATAFIESEFKKIGLKPLKGLTGFRQEFQKERVIPETVEVTIDGESIAASNVVVISEKKEINVKNGLVIKTIPVDNSVSNAAQYFFDKAFSLYRDSTSSLILVAPEFEANFKEFKGYFGERFTRGSKSTKVFVLGKTSASSYTVKATQKLESIKLANVVGVLEGKTKPDEMVVFSGHYDHIGIQKNKINGDSIANGADDDASGTTAVIELARYFKSLRNNNRTLIFVAFTAEEIGGFGSKYFSEQLNPDKVVAMFNIEMIGKKSKWGQNSAFITGFERSDFGKILQKNLINTPFQFNPDPYPEQDLFYRSDNATLARLGVPAHTISTDEIDIDKFYHTVDDEVETLDVKNIAVTIRAIALSSKTIVDGTDTPARIDKATVR